MLLDDFASLTHLNTRDDLLRQSVQLTQRLGFRTVTVLAVQDVLGGPSIFSSVENVSSTIVPFYEDGERGRRDPIMQHCKKSHVPVLWGRDTYERVGEGTMWEQQAPYGFSAGISAALHLPRGRHFFVGMDRDHALPPEPEERVRMAARLQLFISFAVDSALKVLINETPDAWGCALTPRELEVLRWTMEGKTAWELGFILGISEQTAARHINNATNKLGCVNKIQAVMKALRLGLIH